LVANPLRLCLDEIKARPAVTLPVTMECAGNGRALLRPRPMSQPWLLEAIGTAEWTGTPLRDILAEAGVSDHAVELLFTGLDRGVQGNEVQWYQRVTCNPSHRHGIPRAWGITWCSASR
jgi:DMSO/TMAO reductase YedYZ molybdopterin-dependent catalytic subunit